MALLLPIVGFSIVLLGCGGTPTAPAEDEPQARPATKAERASHAAMVKALAEVGSREADENSYVALFRLREYRKLLEDFPGYKTRMMRIKAGTAMPWHTHEGQELTLVLAGGFTDGEKHFLAGDVAAADPTVNHRPVADPGEDCLCLAVTEGPLRLTGPIGRLLNPFIRT